MSINSFPALLFFFLTTSQEVYKDAAAVAFHKEQPHFALWTAFKVIYSSLHFQNSSQTLFRV